MDKKTWISVVVLIIIVFVGAVIYSNQKIKDLDQDLKDREQSLEEALQRPSITINTKHQFRDGAHTFVGLIELPASCYSHDVDVVEGDEITEIALTYEKEEGQVCDEVIKQQEFRITFEAAEDADIIATINGELVNFNVFEVGPDENIDEIDIFIKG